MKITTSDLTNLIDEPYLSRGQEYFQGGLVELISIGAGEVKAKAVGSRVYRVTLTNKRSRLEGQCSCPAFEDFGPCKHMAAVGFAVIASQSEGYSPSSVCREYIEQQASFEEVLLKKTKNDLVSIILRLSDYYPEVIEEVMDEED